MIKSTQFCYFVTMYEKRLITTEDGSHSIELIGKDEQYHSVHGAIQESQHIFINFGLKQIAEIKNEISILEVGMGTGLNLFLSYLFSKNKEQRINYLALEPFPIESEIWKELNYAQQLNRTKLQSDFEKIHSSNWNDKTKLSDNFTFNKKQMSILDIDFNQKFDLVYFDAFNPDLEPGLWTEDVFKKIFGSMKPGSLLTTYSTKGIVKRALKSCGFEIEKNPGPPGKREILNAWKR